jgi:GDP-4-dehydro-6-deoxy-D-mannose reductase
MGKKIIITGSNGFVGKHLMEQAANSGYIPVGVSREEEAVEQNREYDYVQADLTDPLSVGKVPLDDVVAIINLAGLAAVGPSFDNPGLYMHVNVSVLSTVCERLIAEGKSGIRIVAISSGAVYDPQQPLPLTEKSKLDPESSPYAASKIAMEEAAHKYHAAGLDCVVVRPFNHIGPGQLPGFLLPDLLAKIRSLGSGVNEIRVGNLRTERDYTDVRDVARGYIEIATASKSKLSHSTYNVCTGRSLSGEMILELLKNATNNKGLDTIIDEKLFRPSDSPVLYGDSSRLKEDVGWEPAIPIEQTIADFVASAKV